MQEINSVGKFPVCREPDEEELRFSVQAVEDVLRYD